MTLDELLELTSGLDPEDLAELVSDLPDAVAETLATDLSGMVTPAQLSELLPHQKPPSGDWAGWLFLAGRGAGKSYSGHRWLGRLAATTPDLRARLIAPTLGDAVASAQDPQSGVLSFYPEAVLKTSGVEGTRIVWPNRSTIWCIGANSPESLDRLRALTAIDADYFEEAAAIRYLEEAVDQAALSRRGLRLPHPVWLATTTPRPRKQIKDWVTGETRGETVVVTRATTADNPHTPEAYRSRAEALRGTRIYRQEVLGEVLEDIEGALWTQADLVRSLTPEPTDLSRVVIGVDPPAGPGTCGIVVVGADQHGGITVLDDLSVTDVQPGRWARVVASAHQEWTERGFEPLVVAEINQGGRMVTEVLKQAGVTMPVKTVRAAQGKATRAEPVAVLWEADEQQAHLLGTEERIDPALVLLADQMMGWVPGEGDSPDRVDALVWAVTWLRRHSAEPARVSRAARTRRLST